MTKQEQKQSVAFEEDKTLNQEINMFTLKYKIRHDKKTILQTFLANT